MKNYLAPVQDVLDAYGVEPTQGLTKAHAAEKLQSIGPNKLAEAPKEPMWKRLVAQLTDPAIILLIAAAIISGVTSMIQGEADFTDAIVIMAIVVINAVLGLVQESKAEQALEALQEMAAAQSKVLREGSQHVIPSSELVPGDIVLLEAGDAVPADCRVVESAMMKIEESALTGESVPVEKFTHALQLDGKDDIPLGDRKNMVYMGSTVVYGRGVAVVSDTAMKTEMGKIADSISQARDEQTPLQKKLAELSVKMTILVIIICALVFGIGFFQHGSEFISNPDLMIDTFMIAVSLAVAAIPEGLVAVVTIALSLGVTKMSKENAIIRKLTAVETLGCTQTVCSDKTGTLTQNKMTVVQHYTEDMNRHVTAMALCSDAEWDIYEHKAVGEPTEAALVADAAQLGLLKGDLAEQFKRVGEAPFDSGRKMMSVVCKAPDDGLIQFTKGAPDEILKRCTHIRRKDDLIELTDDIRQNILSQNKAMADKALRVLASAERSWVSNPSNYEPVTLEQNMVFVGLSGMIDPVRPEAKSAIAEAHKAGIRVVMITGDHIDTAVAIATELNIITDRTQAITGADLDKISDEELDRCIAQYGVYARVQPEHKVRIVEAWKSQNQIVAMTGDGVNDAPSIKRADIGVGMGITGTDVTKNVADMVLADDNFATIIGAVREGRRVYDNIRKAIQYLLSCNLAEVIAVFIATLFGFTILKPVHMLWINLITDSLPALALSMEEPEKGIMRRRPRPATDGIFAGKLGVDCLVQGIFIAIVTLASYFIGFYLETGHLGVGGMGNSQAGLEGITMAFLTLSMVEMFHSFNMRSRRLSVASIKRQNIWLWVAFAASLVLTFVIIEVDVIAPLFDFVPLPPMAYLIAMGLAFLIIPFTEIYKWIMRCVDRKTGAIEAHQA